MNSPGHLLAGRFFLRLFVAVAILFSAAALSGCFSGKIVDGRRSFYAGDYPAAAKSLSALKDKSGKDHILALLEYALALHVAGDYQESARAFMEADRLIEASDVIHVAQKTASLATNKRITTFRPETFERVLLHTYCAMDFIMMDDWSSARVEAKKALEILDKLDPELQAEPYTRYVCGLIYEVMGDIADAYIEYSKVVAEDPSFTSLYHDLYRIAALRGLGQEAEKWAMQIAKNGGSISQGITTPNLIVLIGAGRSPIKREIDMVVPPSFNRVVLPEYQSSGSLAHHAVLKTGNYAAPSFVLTDLDPLAKKALKKRIAKEIIEEAARVAAKEVIARQIEDQNELLGLAARVAFFASEAADTRSWQTLPRYLGVITQTLPPGTYDIIVQYYADNGAPLDAVTRERVTITEGRRTVLSVRSVK